MSTTFDLSAHITPETAELKPSLIRAFNQEISSIPGILKLTLGEPDFDTPQSIRDAATASLKAGHTHYGPSAGTPALRAAISAFLLRRRGLSYPADDIVVSEGAGEALSAVLTAFLGAGGFMLYPSPAFYIYRSLALLNGSTPVALDTSDTNYVLAPATLRAALEKLDGAPAVLVLNSPNNPTGTALTAEQLQALAEVIRDYNVLVVSDDVYADLCFDAPFHSIAEYLPDRTIIVDSTSKSFAMTGWRIGYFTGPHDMVAAAAKVHQVHVVSPATFSMDAATVAYESCDADIDAMAAEYRRRRDYFGAAMRNLGYETTNPAGAFYLYVRIPDDFVGTAMEYARAMAREAKVACVPGDAFEEITGPDASPSPSRHVRFSYAADMETLHEAVRRLEEWRKPLSETSAQ
ncbi:MAG: aminotransferase class I/II-fold pyridoxal phosphate-dependent enzyme [Bifidobacteriaceae bacterium]|jgi:aspartate/methionine/tyrosine aminotransferase|nr:aminotransferase class I/II-fold pyridoxal phosphate-dependent enzyme [Bifidobacteriaceae bacterium]